MNQPIPAPGAYQALPAPPQLPLRAVQRLGQRTMRDGMYIGLIVALLGHVAAVGSPDYTMWMMHVAVVKMNRELRAYFKRTEEVEVIDDTKKDEVDKPEPEAPEVPLPEPEEAPEPVPSPIPPPESEDAAEDENPYQDDEPYQAPAAQAAEASDIVTAEDGAVDMTGDGWEMYDNDGLTSRATGATGRSGRTEGHVSNPNARPDGTGNGTGSGPPKPRPRPAPKKDLSAPAKIVSGNLWSCPFPSAADLNQVDRAVVVLNVTVGASGKVTAVSVTKDPGYGFGANARRCAQQSKWRAAKNRDGKSISKTVPIRVRFQR